MFLEIVYSKQAKKYLLSQNEKTQSRMKNAVGLLLEEQPKGDIVKLAGVPFDQYRLRVGDYRILYHFDMVNLQIDLILPRGNAYKR